MLKILGWIVAVPVGIFALLMLYFMIAPRSPDDIAKADARRSIEYCWSEQKRKSFDPSMQRFVAGACENLEADFRQRYSVAP